MVGDKRFLVRGMYIDGNVALIILEIARPEALLEHNTVTSQSNSNTGGSLSRHSCTKYGRQKGNGRYIMINFNRQ